MTYWIAGRVRAIRGVLAIVGAEAPFGQPGYEPLTWEGYAALRHVTRAARAAVAGGRGFSAPPASVAELVRRAHPPLSYREHIRV